MSETEVTRFEHNGLTVIIHYDWDPENPREHENLGKILYLSSRYILGDEVMSQEDIEEIINGDVFFLPVFAHIHSGVMLSTGGFADPFDSGQCGVIYCTKEDARKAFPGVSEDELRERIEECFKAEIEMFSNYLNGTVYGYIIESDLGEEDSCWGFYGHDDVIEAAKEAADHCVIPRPCEIDVDVCNSSELVAQC